MSGPAEIASEFAAACGAADAEWQARLVDAIKASQAELLERVAREFEISARIDQENATEFHRPYDGGLRAVRAAEYWQGKADARKGIALLIRLYKQAFVYGRNG